MKSSRGEIKICDILDMAGLQYVEEYSFPDLVSSSGRPLRFDFAVLDDNGDIDFLISIFTSGLSCIGLSPILPDSNVCDSSTNTASFKGTKL